MFRNLSHGTKKNHEKTSGNLSTGPSVFFFFFSILFSKGSQQIEIKIEAKSKSNGILSYFYTTVHHFRAQGL